MNSTIPTHYQIRIEPDFEDFSFKGFTTVHMITEESIVNLTMNSVDLNINSVTLITNNSKKTLKFSLDLNAEEILLEFPIEVKGKFEIVFYYTGEIKDDLKGLYKTEYKVGSELHAGAVTQFETEDARRMFPCFDEPGMKATFDLEVIVDNNLATISNTPIKSEEKLQSNKKKVVFETTPKMSTYLLFLGIAEFESIEDKLGKIDVKVINHPGLVQYSHEALKFGVKSLDYCQTYFNIAYPLPKLDLISTPAFAAGAMENWGAILFRQNDLLTFPGSTTKLQERRIKEVIAHEITHQWFGNLVSPKFWKYIWLNESFADFFGHNIVDHYYPELGIWDYTVSFAINVALIADAYHETVPIEIEGQKQTSYNIKSVPIIYNKGGAILRMVEDFVGKENYQKGLQLYLTKHAYDVASSDDLWSAIEQVSHMPVSQLMKSWVLKPGYPLISVSKENGKLNFKQERFTYLPNSDKTLWMIPISITFFTAKGEQIKKQFLLEKESDIFDPKVDFKAFKVNSNHIGFYCVQYKTEDLENLVQYIKNDKFSVLDGWNLVKDLYTLFKAGKLLLDQYLQFIINFKSEKYHTAIRTISEQLAELYGLAKGKSKQKIQSEGIKFHEFMLNKINFEPQKNESNLVSIMRNTLLINGALLGSQKAIDFGLKQFKSLKEGKTISADIKEAVLSIGASETNDLNWFLTQFDQAQNEADIVTYGTSFGDFSDPKVLEKVLDEIVFTKIPNRNQSQIINRLCMNPKAAPLIWKWFIANLDNIGSMHRSIQERTINSVVSNALDETTKKDMEEFFAEYNKKSKLSQITTEKSFETLEINFRVKEFLKE